MAVRKDCRYCFHYDICTEHHKVSHDWDARICHFFKDKSKFVELPCKVGDTLYDIYEFVENRDCPEIMEAKANEITLMNTKRGLCYCIDSTIFYPSDFGKYVFLTQKEAEAKLKELNGNE